MRSVIDITAVSQIRLRRHATHFILRVIKIHINDGPSFALSTIQKSLLLCDSFLQFSVLH